MVRKNQEAYVDACWDQIGDILTAEMKFNLTRLAIEALGALKRKHYDVLPPERLVQLFGPALPRIEALGTAAQTFRINGKVASIGGQPRAIEHAGGAGRYGHASRRESGQPLAADGGALESRDSRAAGPLHQLRRDDGARDEPARGVLRSTRSHRTASSARRCSRESI